MIFGDIISPNQQPKHQHQHHQHHQQKQQQQNILITWHAKSWQTQTDNTSFLLPSLFPQLYFRPTLRTLQHVLAKKIRFTSSFVAFTDTYPCWLGCAVLLPLLLFFFSKKGDKRKRHPNCIKNHELNLIYIWKM